MRQVKIGQKWRRKNGAIVEVVEEKLDGALKMVRLVPVSGPRSRASWKWEDLVLYELTLVEDVKPCQNFEW